jgi:hypothetical protein
VRSQRANPTTHHAAAAAAANLSPLNVHVEVSRRRQRELRSDKGLPWPTAKFFFQQP